MFVGPMGIGPVPGGPMIPGAFTSAASMGQMGPPMGPIGHQMLPISVPVPVPLPAAGPVAGPMGGGGGGGKMGAGSVGHGQGIKMAVAATRKKTAEGQEMRHEMRERMRYIMYEIDETNGHFISNRNEPFQFLDVCCCPGGFSTYTLTAGTAPRKGIGLSLPPELGGHLPAIEQETDKYFLQFVDVTTVAANVRVEDMGVGQPGGSRHALRMNAALDEPPTNRCQLVILDGSFLGGKDWIHKETTLPDAENPAFNVYRSNTAAHKALLVAQLIIMANNLAPGGRLVLRLNMFPDMFTIGVLGLLRQVFAGDVASYKPRSCHVHVGSYYLVCTGFQPEKAYFLQWVPRWHTCLTNLRAGKEAPKFIPFPGLSLDSAGGTQTLWTRAMYTYHVHLWRFLKLVEVAMEEKAVLDKRTPHRSREGRFTNSCGRIFAGVPCSGRCNAAHSFTELHPFVQKAFREPRGFLYHPNDPILLTSPPVPYDPLPETLLELRQQAHIQAIVQAQAAANQQAAQMAAAMRAAAQGGGGNVLGHVGSYDNAVELGMAGEWVHGLMRDPRDTAEAGEDALLLFMRADDNAVLEGGFDEEPPPYPIPHPQPPPTAADDAAVAATAGAPSPAASGVEEACSAVQGTATAPSGNSERGDGAAEIGIDMELDGGPTADTAAKPPRGGGGAADAAVSVVRPELLRMSGYQPRLGLLTMEVEDDESLDAMLAFLGS